MFEKVKKWLAPPIFPNDEDKTRKALVLSAVLTSILKIAIPVTLALFLVAVQKIGISVLLFLLLSLVAGSYSLLRNGRVDAASRTYVIGIWILFTLLYILSGRTSSTASNLMIAVVVTAGILLGRNGALTFAALSSLVILTMALLETNGYPLLILFPEPPLPSWVTWTISVLLTLQPLNLTLQRNMRSTQTLRESEERLKFVLEGSQLGYWDWDIKTGAVRRNEQWARMLGYTLEEIEASVKQWTDLHHPDDREKAWKSINDHLEGRTSEHKAEYRMRTRDGAYKWILDQARIVERDAEGNPLRMSGTHTDITDRKRIEAEEYELRTMAEALSDSAAALNSSLNLDDVLDRIIDNVELVLQHDTVGIIMLDETRRFARVTRYHDTRGNQNSKEETQFSILEARNLREMQLSGEPVIIADTKEYEGWVHTEAGAWIRSVLGVPIKVKQEVIGFLNISRAEPNSFRQKDVERLQAFVNYAGIAIENAHLYEEVRRRALTDPLTGIFNRTFFQAELTRLEGSRGFPVSIIVADLDNMKLTNDTLGHAVGDELLKITARSLQDIFRSDEIIARIGGDEFAVLLPGTDEPKADEIITRIHEKMQLHNEAHPELPIQLSVGVATARENSLKAAFTIADQRMYAEKSKHKNIRNRSADVQKF
ncbi:MAG: diguanylate cyclase [Anaerolineae bacterium]|nr:diguanylate cyclase [Anaerolineae bacterium]